MDTEGPVSVLDRRARSSSRDRVIADRITRQRSPGPAFRHRGRQRYGSQQSVDGEKRGTFSDVNDENATTGEDATILYRIAQPYRTSFSAAHSVTWGRARPVHQQPKTPPSNTDRSRSLSPTASLRSNTSIMSAPPAPYSSILHTGHYRPSTGAMYPGDKRRPRGRSKSPKRVTYNTRVTVRHSDTEDNMFTQLSEGEDFGLGPYEAPLRPIKSPFARSVISPRYNEFSQISPTPAGISPTSPVSPPINSSPRRYDIINNSNSNIANSNDSISKHHQPPPLPPAQRRVRDVTNTAGRGIPHQQQQHHQIQQKPPSSPHSPLPPHTSSSSPPTSSAALYDTPMRPHSHKSHGPDYTSELVDLSQQIMQMEWSPRQARSSRGRPPPGPPNTSSSSSSNNHNNNNNNNHRTTSSNDNLGNTTNNNNHTNNMLFSPPPGGTTTTSATTTSSPPLLDREQTPYTTTGQSHQPLSILKESRNGPDSVISQGLGQIQTGVITSGNGVVREGDVIGRRTPDSRSSPSRNNPFRTEHGESDRDTDKLAESSPSPPPGVSTTRHYDHDRPFSFHKALRGDYGEDLQRLARDGLLADYCPAEPDTDTADHLDMNVMDAGVKENGGVPGRNDVPERRGPGRFPVDSDETPSPVEETSPGRNGSPVEVTRQESHSDTANQPEGTSSGRLTPSKRSVSLSISNFLKKFSPHLRRKPSSRSHNSSRERGRQGKSNSKTGSAEGSAQSLANTASDPDTDHEQGLGDKKDKKNKEKGSGRFSRSQVRQSFMKLVGRSSSRSKKKNKKGVTSDSEDPPTIPTPAHYTIEPHDPDCGVDASSADELDNINTHNGIILTTNNGTSVINTATHSNSSNSNGKVVTSSGGHLDLTSVRIMNAIEKNAVAEQDIYRRFKEMQHSSPKTVEESLNTSSYDNPSPPSEYQTNNFSTYPVTISHTSVPDTTTKLAKPEPVRPSAGHYTSAYTTRATADNHKTTHSPIRNSLSSEGPMDFFTESDISAILQAAKTENRSKFFEPLSPQPLHHQDTTSLSLSEQQQQPKQNFYPPSSQQATPPCSLDVGGFSMDGRPKKLSHLAGVGSLSGDESIGECSLDVNLTASEPSLLSGINQSGGSKQAILSHSLVSSSEAKESDSVRLRRLTNREDNNKENSEPHTTKLSSRSDPPSPVDPSHKPSYLKLSCAVSGYGKYSRYSTYKDVNRRSPFSSQSSLRSEVSSPEPGSMPAERKPGEEGTPEHNNHNHHDNHTSNRLSPSLSPSYRGVEVLTINHKPTVTSATATVNGHSGAHIKYPTGDIVKDGEYFLQHTQFEEDRIRGLCLRAEAHMRAHDLPEEACGLIRSAIGKANLLLTQKFVQFRELCQNHMVPDPDEPETLWGDLQGFWDMVKIQIDNVDDLFAEIELMRHNGWQEIPKQMSRRSSASSSPKSGTISQVSTPSATPGSKRKNIKPPGSGGSSKNTPDSSPERTQKARQAAKARDEARRKLLAERRAAMKQQLQQQQQAGGENASVEIFVPDKK